MIGPLVGAQRQPLAPINFRPLLPIVFLALRLPPAARLTLSLLRLSAAEPANYWLGWFGQ